MSLFSRTLRTDASSLAPFLLRLMLGAVFIGHGAQKLFGWWGGGGFEATAKSFEQGLILNVQGFCGFIANLIAQRGHSGLGWFALDGNLELLRR